MPKKLIGTESYQVPRNADLGTAAFQDAESVNIGGGVITLNNSSTTGYFQDTYISDVNPSLFLDFANSKVLDQRITFQRSTTATYYDGKTTAKAEENLILYSQDFSQSVWNKSSTICTINSAIAPDRTLTASTLTPTASTNAFSLFQVVTNLVPEQTQSFYVKPNGYSKVMLRESNAGGNYAAFDISTGTIIFDGSGGTAAITSAGNGWYRISMSISYTAGATRPSLYILDPNYTTGAMGAFTADGVSGVFVWGAQFESRLTLTAYTPTTSYPISKSIPVLQTAPANTPRFDHDPATGESKGFLVEEARTNLNLSSNVNNGGNYNGTTENNAAVSPTGSNDANRFIPNFGTGIGNSATILTPSYTTGTGTRAYSVFVKAFGMNAVRLYDNDTGVSCYFNLLTGEAYSLACLSAGSVNCGNGWWRLWMTGTSAVTTSYFQIYSGATGDGFSGWLWFGAQIESGSFPTSYIPTSGATVTRSADNASMTGTNFSSWYRQDEGTIVTESSVPFLISGTANQAILEIGNTGTYNDGYVLFNKQSTSNISVATNVSGSTKYYAITSPVVTNTVYKIAFCYNRDLQLTAVNGSYITPNLAATDVVNAVTMTIGAYNDNSYKLNGHIRRIKYFNSRLSKAELQEMTL